MVKAGLAYQAISQERQDFFLSARLTKLIPDDSLAWWMSTQIGNIAQAAARSAQPYRRHIVGLPLQRSLFGLIARAATTIGLPGLASELDFPGRLDENGDLFFGSIAGRRAD
jgi:hypothetical protein